MVSFNNCCLFVETTISLLVNAAIKTERKITMEAGLTGFDNWLNDGSEKEK